ncbi:MAG: nucleotide exchange factor GrpE, partial [Mycoplasmoidaceae bacterium]|nr:nucleotide exchange factor GrpE [Mycoplasmoidaceae bacterium]
KPDDPKVLNYQKGFNMFLTMFKTLLNDINVQEIDVKVGEEFNPNFMECFELQNSNDIKENHVIKVVNKGYKLHERIIVPTLVVVCKKAN